MHTRTHAHTHTHCVKHAGKLGACCPRLLHIVRIRPAAHFLYAGCWAHAPLRVGSTGLQPLPERKVFGFSPFHPFLSSALNLACTAVQECVCVTGDFSQSCVIIALVSACAVSVQHKTTRRLSAVSFFDCCSLALCTRDRDVPHVPA